MKKTWVGSLAIAVAMSIPFIGNADSAKAANYLGYKMKNRTILWKNATTNRDYHVAAVEAMNSWGSWNSNALAWVNTHHTNSYAKRRFVFTHEVGHALGLARNELG